MTGVRYASMQVVSPRGTILTMGMTREERETCAKPTSEATRPTSSSCAVKV